MSENHMSHQNLIKRAICFVDDQRPQRRLAMFRGEKVVRFFAGAGETNVLQAVRDGLADLGQVQVDRQGAISIEPTLRSSLVRTTLSGRLRKRGREYEVRLAYCCAPTRLGWFLPVLGWVTRSSVADAVRQALRKLNGDMTATPDQRFSGVYAVSRQSQGYAWAEV
jgi:hypothetical protein